jgi:hypothetical protein
MTPAWPEEDPPTFEEYVLTLKRLYPALACVWNDAMEEQTRHSVTTTPGGKVRDKMPDLVSNSINDIFGSYSPEYSKIQAPVLTFFSIRDGTDYLSSEFMSEAQKAEVLHFFSTELQPVQRIQIDTFKRQLPLARVVELPRGHHYCFLRDEGAVVHEMTAFLLQDCIAGPPSGPA